MAVARPPVEAKIGKLLQSLDVRAIGGRKLLVNPQRLGNAPLERKAPRFCMLALVTPQAALRCERFGCGRLSQSVFTGQDCRLAEAEPGQREQAVSFCGT